MEAYMIITEKIMNELLTDDGHMGTVQYTSEFNSYDRKRGTISTLKNLGAKNIIHIGCCGHLQNIQKQMENNAHFHVMLLNNFEKVIGFDINEEAVSYLSSSGIPHVYKKDFVNESQEIFPIINNVFKDEPYMILLPEVLEHISNPVTFLSETVKYYGKSENKIVITVPNAYGFGRVLDALLHNKEHINMDHKYMFTPTTLLKVMSTSNITPTDIYFFDLYRYSRVFKKPVLGNTILAVGKFI